jgi:DNA polymerase-3 subunit delta'
MKTDQALQLFQHAYEADRVAQGYVIEGPLRGAAREFVEHALQVLFCTERKRPCGKCQACRGATQHTHPDLTWVEPQKKSRLISVEQVRAFQKTIFQTSFLGGWKACVIFAADRLGDSASNAFLKVLEEPPGKTVFFLMTDSPQALLATILSRCQHIALSEAAEELPAEWKKTLVEALAGTVPGFMIGALATAERVNGLLGEVKKAAAAEVAERLKGETLEEEDETIDARVSARYREIRSTLMRTMLLWYRDILLLSNGADDGLVYHRAQLDFLKKKAQALTWRQVQRNVEMVETMNRQMDRNLPERAVLSFGFGQIR